MHRLETRGDRHLPAMGPDLVSRCGGGLHRGAPSGGRGASIKPFRTRHQRRLDELSSIGLDLPPAPPSSDFARRVRLALNQHGFKVYATGRRGEPEVCLVQFLDGGDWADADLVLRDLGYFAGPVERDPETGDAFVEISARLNSHRAHG